MTQHVVTVEMALLGGLAVSLVSGIVTKFFVSKDCVKEHQCKERREADKELAEEKLHRIDDKLDTIINIVKQD